MFKLEYLWRGFPGHPLHPPLTDAAIGAYTAATALAIADVSGVLDRNGAVGWFVLTAVGWCVLVVGGWLGGTITFVHGMRVLNLVDEPTARAVMPAPLPEKEQAEA
jgi:hypothetical protein